MISMSKKNNPDLVLLLNKISTLEAHVAENYANIQWLTTLYSTLSKRQWYIVTGIIITILLQILVLVFRV